MQYLSKPSICQELADTGDVAMQCEVFHDGKLEIKIGFRPNEPKSPPADFKSTIEAIVRMEDTVKVAHSSIQFQMYLPIPKRA